MILNYCNDISSEFIFLNSEESMHTIKVLRKKIGDKLHIINGEGFFCEAEIVNDNHKRCGIKILNREKKDFRRNYKLHVAIAPTKNIDRFEWFIEKAIEIGIDEITPLITSHSERKVVKDERIEKIIISTIKQAKVFYKPKYNNIISFDKFIKNSNENLFIAHCYEAEKKLLKEIYPRNTNATILIGPEGDFSEDEVNQALSNGAKEFSLGENRLRTETAGIVACNTIAILNQ